MKALCIHAHFDDFEFVAGGTFSLWKKALGSEFQGKLVVCTDGAAGHHLHSRAQTARIRWREQLRSAVLGDYACEKLVLPNGRTPREGCLVADRPLLASLWKAIRDFEPDYLFAPPLPADPRAGVHADHWVVAEAVRKVAYFINVPQAFTPEFPSRERMASPRTVPVILTTYDAYMAGANAYDLAIETEPVFDLVASLTWCHQSQISEWLPWVGRHSMSKPGSREDWNRTLRERVIRQNRDLGMNHRRATEVFSLTAWGAVPTLQKLQADMPFLRLSQPAAKRLARQLAAWGSSP
ncbi:MAG: PIG-L family deacetylase [Verrucomicrobia bacterium]|nr:PIG-L family deacetylase [Verrucomicrobiota bacterium]